MARSPRDRDPSPHVAVVGAGIGGMAAALLLSRAGARVTLLERVPEPAPVGAAIALFPNGLAVLYGLGLRERLTSRSYATDAGGLRFGTHTRRAALPDFGDGLDHALGVTRAHLFDVLHEAVRADDRIDTRFGHELVHATPHGDLTVRPAPASALTIRPASADDLPLLPAPASDLTVRPASDGHVTLHSASDGETARPALNDDPTLRPVTDDETVRPAPDGDSTVRPASGGDSAARPAPALGVGGGERDLARVDLVVGADGIGSVVRSCGRFGARRGRTRGLTVRVLVEGEPFPADVGEFWSEHGIAMGVPMGGGVSYLAISASRGAARDAMVRRDLPALRRLVAAMIPGGDTALASMDSFDELILTPIETVSCRRWVDGRLVLLGDAAHAMAPHLAQGANSALLDAYVLAQELARALDGGRTDDACAQAARAYEQRRRRTANALRWLSEAYRVASESATVPGVRHVRDAFMGTAGGSPAVTRRYLRLVQQEDPAEVQRRVRGLAAARPGRR